MAYIEVDNKLKADAEIIYIKLGMSVSDAVNMFFEQTKLHDGLPFGIKKNGTIDEVDPSWMIWLSGALKQGCAPDELRDILLKNNFTIDAVKRAMGKAFNDISEPTGIDYKALSEVNITKVAKRIEDDRLQLYVLENFMSEEESDELVKLISEHLRPSTLSYASNDKDFRTSSTCDMSFIKSPIVTRADEKIARTLGIQLPYSEGIQAQRYDVGQQFKAHYDYFTPGTPVYEKFASFLGNRTWTFMVYLNDTPKGGGTKFVNIDKTFYPKKGTAVIWNNLYPDGKPNPDTLHWGLPVEEGEKVIITKWFRERGEGPMFY